MKILIEINSNQAGSACYRSNLRRLATRGTAQALDRKGTQRIYPICYLKQVTSMTEFEACVGLGIFFIILAPISAIFGALLRVGRKGD
jgi:hypothetical protein